MHGEKVEEVEELRLDLADVKEMYKAQVRLRLTNKFSLIISLSNSIGIFLKNDFASEASAAVSKVHDKKRH